MSRTIVIVGAGFCGTAVAINLLRMRHEQPLRVALIDASQIARGLAFRSYRHRYLLNVPAARMSARADEPLEFLDFARHRLPDAAPEDFLPRELYGEYLEWALRRAEHACPAHVQLQRMHGVVVALERIRRTSGYQLFLADGRMLRADEIVLALGNPKPAPLPVHQDLQGSARYLDDPWRSPPTFRPGESVLVAGTGLTMADVVVAGLPAARDRLVIHAISRRGLLPAPQSRFRPVRNTHDAALLLTAASSSLLSLSRAIRKLSEEVLAQHGDWREVIALVRESAPSLWQRLTENERRRFLRHLRPYWDVHRHRLADTMSPVLQDLRSDGHLQVHAARILAIEPCDTKIRVRFRRRGQLQSAHLLVDRVINCTGPDYDVKNTRDRLLRSLLAQGVATRDPLGLGLVTDEVGALVAANGRARDGVYYVGPMLRPAYWESTAVAELREHARRLARHLVARESAAALRPTRPDHPARRLHHLG